jgi:hypothetical protein
MKTIRNAGASTESELTFLETVIQYEDKKAASCGVVNSWLRSLKSEQLEHSGATRAMLTPHGPPISPPDELPASLAKPCRIASIVAVTNQLLLMSYNAAVMNDS